MASAKTAILTNFMSNPPLTGNQTDPKTPRRTAAEPANPSASGPWLAAGSGSQEALVLGSSASKDPSFGRFAIKFNRCENRKFGKALTAKRATLRADGSPTFKPLARSC
jgi:hypothetical protein